MSKLLSVLMNQLARAYLFFHISDSHQDVRRPTDPPARDNDKRQFSLHSIPHQLHVHYCTIMTEQTEARFLQARQARAQATSAQRLKRTSRNKEQQTAKDFWTFLRRDFENWQSRLDRLQQQESTTVQSNELDRLLQDLYALKTKSLSSNDVMELPAADVRLLHDEFTTRATQLEQVSKQLIPIQKFSFQRYRAAMQQQQQQQEEEENVCNGTTREKTVARMSNQDEKPTTTLAGNAIENYKNATLVVNSNGDLVIRDEHTEKEHTVHQTEANENASSLLVQNLQHCHVNM
jgi:hypothetical protein